MSSVAANNSNSEEITMSTQNRKPRYQYSYSNIRSNAINLASDASNNNNDEIDHDHSMSPKSPQNTPTMPTLIPDGPSSNNEQKPIFQVFVKIDASGTRLSGDNVQISYSPGDTCDELEKAAKIALFTEHRCCMDHFRFEYKNGRSWNKVKQTAIDAGNLDLTISNVTFRLCLKS